MKIEITYIGYSTTMMKKLIQHKDFVLKKVITKPGVLNENLFRSLKENDIAVVEDDSAEKLDDNVDTNICLIYKYAHIIPPNIIEKKAYYNIHPGSIRTNRGAHPLRWSILLGDEKTCLSLYKIDGIDEGDLICEEPVNIFNLNYEDADKNMDMHLGTVLNLFLSFLINGGKCEHVTEGIYRNKVSEEDYRIDLGKDSFTVIQQKIRAVSDFGGAVVVCDNVKYRAVRIMRINEFYGMLNECSNEKSFYMIGDDGNKMFLECSKYEWR